MKSDQSASADSPGADHLILAARQGSDAALDHLLELLSEYLWKECRLRPRSGLSPSRSLSDLIQDTLVQVRISFQRFERDTVSELQQWSRTILYRRWQHWVRNYSTRNQEQRKEKLFLAIRARTGERTDSVGPESVFEQREEARRCYGIFKSALRPHEQFIMELRLFKGLKYKDVARLGRTTEKAAEKAYARAIVRLRELCNDHEVE
jgi:RNA polymerase sigma factor (sigma-70 family)